MFEDASDYLPDEGSKADRVLMGLKALRDGRPSAAGRPKLPPDATKLTNVAAELSGRLVDQGLITDSDVRDALPAHGPANSDTLTARQPTPDASSPPTKPPEETTAPLPFEPTASAVRPEGPIFVVHGHADSLRHEVVRVLERATGREVIVLHEQANAGRTVLEKFEHHAATAAFAVVLLTGDDVGGRSGQPTSPRGRQNVIFELGFFFGKLGRARVAVLFEPGVEGPSDISGLVYIEIDPHGAWKTGLARELRAVDIAVDYERIP